MALCRLEQSVLGVTPAERYYGTDSIDTLLTQAGYGRPGTVSSGPGPYDGIKRGAQNVASGFGFGGGLVSKDYWDALFKAPGRANYQLLGGLGTGGDSGGGVFANIRGTEYLVGIADYISAAFQYGSSTYSLRVSLYNDWIDTTIAANPAPVPIPGAVWLFGSGLAGLVALRKRFAA